jgi:8-oxo-dGTP pyrophosphatase MutT (NUDIX family)
VAGGITAGDLPRQSILREFSEEASLPPQIVSPLLRQAGVVTYCYRQTLGWLQPEVQYVYDIKLPSDGSIKPTTNPADGEVESFELMGLEEVVGKMVGGEFKANCALCVSLFPHRVLSFGLISFFLLTGCSSISSSDTDC